MKTLVVLLLDPDLEEDVLNNLHLRLGLDGVLVRRHGSHHEIWPAIREFSMVLLCGTQTVFSSMPLLFSLARSEVELSTIGRSTLETVGGRRRVSSASYTVLLERLFAGADGTKPTVDLCSVSQREVSDADESSILTEILNDHADSRRVARRLGVLLNLCEKTKLSIACLCVAAFGSNEGSLSDRVLALEALGNAYADKPAVNLHFLDLALAQVAMVGPEAVVSSDIHLSLLRTKRFCLVRLWCDDPTELLDHCAKERSVLEGEGRQVEIIGVLCTEADALRKVGDHEGAIHSLKRALVHAEMLGDLTLESKLRHQLANVLSDKGETKRSLEMMICAYVINRREGDISSMSLSASHIGRCYQTLGNWSEALHFHRQALQIDRMRRNWRGMMYECKQLSHCMNALDDKQGALAYADSGLQFARMYGDRQGILSALTALWLRADRGPVSLALYERRKEIMTQMASDCLSPESKGGPLFHAWQRVILDAFASLDSVLVTVNLRDASSVLVPREAICGTSRVGKQLRVRFSAIKPHKMRFDPNGLWARIDFGLGDRECFIAWNAILKCVQNDG